MASKTSRGEGEWLGTLLQRPAGMPAVLVASLVILLVGALYCSGYEALTTGYDNWPGSLIWAAYALLPWYLLFEWIRRREQERSERFSAARIVFLLVAVGAASLLAEQIDYRLGSSDPPPVLLSLLRRAPGIAITLALIAVSRLVAWRPARDGRESADLLANWRAIRWIGAADNYLEVHYPERVATVRMTMREAERQLRSLGFVRIHRSAIVNRSAVAAAGGEEVRLVDARSFRSERRSPPTCDRSAEFRHFATLDLPGAEPHACMAAKVAETGMQAIRLTCLAAVAAAVPAIAQEGPISRARQVTASYTFDLVPSPKSERAVMIRIIDGREQLFLTDASGGNERQLTRDDANHEDPVWSPDGKSIAFVLIKDGKKSLALIDPASSRTELLGPAGQSPIHPSFTPDGKTLLYCTDDDLRPPAKNESEIYAMDLATRQVRTVISGGVNTYPVMSPDGRKIAWRKIVGDMNSEVFVADSDGRNAVNITKHHAWEGWPAWSPDGRTIAFAGNRGGAWQIFLANPDGSNLRLLAATEGRGTSPKWTADGKAIFFTVCRNSQERRGCDIYLADVPQAETDGPA